MAFSEILYLRNSHAENRYPLSVKIAYINIIRTIDKACKDFNFHAKTSEKV
jgi:hypothetical protein